MCYQQAYSGNTDFTKSFYNDFLNLTGINGQNKPCIVFADIIHILLIFRSLLERVVKLFSFSSVL
jgi:hypothetical protein